MNDQNKLTNLRSLMSKNNIDGYFLPHEDEFLSEYLPKYTERLKWLTNFSGSAGLAFIGIKKASLKAIKYPKFSKISQITLLFLFGFIDNI